MSRKFVELNKKIHDRKEFDCGNEQLNDFLKTKAVRHRELRVSRTLVLPAIEPADSNMHCVDSYYTTSAMTIERSSLPCGKKLPQYPVPVFLIGRLAVANRMKGQGLGEITLMRAMKELYLATSSVQAVAIVVDPIDDGADSFYRKYGFLDLNDGKSRLFIPMGTVASVFK